MSEGRRGAGVAGAGVTGAGVTGAGAIQRSEADARALRFAASWSSHADLWSLDRRVLFLNHGSFGACPSAVLATQQALRARMEAEPVRFFVREAQALLDSARDVLADFVGADPEGLVFVDNATTGVNTALAALELAPGDRVLVTDHGYNACRNALAVRCAAAGAHVDVVPMGMPFDSDQFSARLLSAVTPRTRFALLDHITSATACVLPVATLTESLAALGVDVVVDGAHAPGQLPLDVTAIDAAFYTGNLHKWPCAPKGAAFLWVRPDWRDRTRPLVTSHGHNAPPSPRGAFHTCFDWTGTRDPTAWLAVPAALRAMATTVAGGWPALMAHNHAVAVEWRARLQGSLGATPTAPPRAMGAMTALRLPRLRSDLPTSTLPSVHALQDLLWRDHGIEVPVMPDPNLPDLSLPGRRPQDRHQSERQRVLIRLSAQVYLTPDAVDHVVAAVTPWLADA